MLSGAPDRSVPSQPRAWRPAAVTPGTSVRATTLPIAVMMAVRASFRLFFVLTLDTPLVRHLPDRSRRAIERVFGVLLVSPGIRVDDDEFGMHYNACPSPRDFGAKDQRDGNGT